MCAGPDAADLFVRLAAALALLFGGALILDISRGLIARVPSRTKDKDHD